jgi:hypothetical protein
MKLRSSITSHKKRSSQKAVSVPFVGCKNTNVTDKFLKKITEFLNIPCFSSGDSCYRESLFRRTMFNFFPNAFIYLTESIRKVSSEIGSYKTSAVGLSIAAVDDHQKQQAQQKSPNRSNVMAKRRRIQLYQ